MSESALRFAEGPAAREGPTRAAVVAVVGLTFLAVAVRALSVGGHALLYGDEHLSLKNLDASWSEALALYDNRGTGVPFLLLQKVAVELFGAGLLAYRLPAILPALAAVLIAYPVARRLVGGTAGLLAVPGFALTSLFLYYASFGRAYALVALLALLFVGAAARVAAEPEPRPRTYAALALTSGLLPWVHLATAVPVLLVGATALARAAVRPHGWRRAARLALALAVGALLALALHWPAREAVLAFAREKAGEGELDFGVLDVAALVVGSRGAALAWTVGLALALVAILARARADAALVVVASLGPIVGLVALAPAGGVYAFARYLVVGLPFQAMLLAWLVIELVRRLPFARPVADRVGLACGVALIAATAAAGPLLRGRATSGPFAASALSLLSLPHFDEPWDETPEFYRTLAASGEPARIIEIPEQVSRSALLYRNHWLVHRKDVEIGFALASDPADIPRGPYVHVSEEGLADLDADYLVVHVAIDRELAAYWRFVHQRVASALGRADLAPFLRAFGNFGSRFGEREMVLRGLSRFGAPFYTDPYLVVWKLR